MSKDATIRPACELRDGADRTSGAPARGQALGTRTGGHVACSTTGMSLAAPLSGRPGRRRARAGCSSIPSTRCRIRPSAAARLPPARCSSARRGATPSPSSASLSTKVGGRSVRVSEEVVWETPFCRLLHFKRDIDPARAAQDPRLLLVAPMSGHFATLLRGTVETFLPDHEVYITDWQDARDVPLSRRAASISTTTSTPWPPCSASSAATCMCSRCASRPCRCWPPRP